MLGHYLLVLTVFYNLIAALGNTKSIMVNEEHSQYKEKKMKVIPDEGSRLRPSLCFQEFELYVSKNAGEVLHLLIYLF